MTALNTAQSPSTPPQGETHIDTAHTLTADLPASSDKDTIEPQWVHRVRAVVRANADDPYKQSEDLTLLKAEYMRKRYNKAMKLK